MKRSNWFALVLITAVGLSSGCDNSNGTKSEKESGSSASHVHADGSVHEGDGHDHHHVEGHAHAPGPHGGAIADWGGGKYHVEFTVDRIRKEATVYVFGTDERTPVPIDAEEISLSIKDPAITISLKASPLGSEILGGSSRFVGTDEGLGAEREFEGSITGVVDGTPYTGDFKQEPKVEADRS